MILDRETAGNVDRVGGDIEVKGGLGATEVGPLRHRLEMVHRLGRFDLDRSDQLVTLIVGRQHEIRINLNLSDLYGDRLARANVHGDFVTTLQLQLEQSDDTVMFELFADRPYENRTHGTSRREYRCVACLESGILARLPSTCIAGSRSGVGTLDGLLLTAENVEVISAAENRSAVPAHSILIVDDDRSVTETFARALELEGFAVSTALSPGLGLELAGHLHPDAIILDLRMPLINGIQFLREIRSRPDLRQVPVAIVTGDYFLPEPLQAELRELRASVRFKPLWLEDLVDLARALTRR